MRLSARLSLTVLALALGACSYLPKKAPETPKATGVVAQTGALKVHPGLLGQPVPPELQIKDEIKVAAAEAVATEAAKPAADPLAQRSVHFDFRSAEIKAEDAAILAAHAERLNKNPKVQLRVEGNTDERGSEESNKRLGQQRADAVKQALTAKGASGKQIKTVSNGEKKPKASGHDEAAWAENRRADLIYENAE